MPIGGGTFTQYDKEVPGVYANFSNVQNSDMTPIRGVVAFLIPTTKVEVSKITEITLQNYRTSLTDYADATNFYKLEDLLPYCREILYNASKVYAIPVKAEVGVSITYTFDPKVLTNLEFNVLLHHDLKEDGFVIEKVAEFLKSCLEKSDKRFTIVVDGNNGTIETKITDNKKWYVYSYAPKSSFYISGLLSGAQIGSSVSGDEYQGTLDTTDWIPPSIEDQSAELKKGRFLYYSIGNSLRVLKDITYQASATDASYNDKIGQIVRFEKYIYNWFSFLFMNQIHGYPNTAETRRAIKGVIVNHFMKLESENILQNVQPTDVEVSAGGSKDSIIIKIRYHPVSGINYIYITFEVD